MKENELRSFSNPLGDYGITYDTYLLTKFWKPNMHQEANTLARIIEPQMMNSEHSDGLGKLKLNQFWKYKK